MDADSAGVYRLDERSCVLRRLRHPAPAHRAVDRERPAARAGPGARRRRLLTFDAGAAGFPEPRAEASAELIGVLLADRRRIAELELRLHRIAELTGPAPGGGVDAAPGSGQDSSV
jgi:hypothetical protein